MTRVTRAILGPVKPEVPVLSSLINKTNKRILQKRSNEHELQIAATWLHVR